ncbi:MAG TPA: hypothetical protein IAA88_00535 [Candidatus Avimuribaculum pullicola]|nr:hypothetical protein [Candidatus Avimuribaculum pullicola]
MKSIKISTIVCALGVFAIAGLALWSCSSDNNITSEPQVINQEDETTVRTLDRFSEIEPNFASFLMQSKTRSSSYAVKDTLPDVVPSKSKWDETVYEFKNDEGITAQMVKGEYRGKTTLACAYYIKNENVETGTKILLLQQMDANEYILCNQNDEPLMKVIHNGDNNFEYALLADQRKVSKELCNIGMVVAGSAVSFFAIPTWGAAIGFGIIWYMLTDLVCQ